MHAGVAQGAIARGHSKLCRLQTFLIRFQADRFRNSSIPESDGAAGGVNTDYGSPDFSD
jgi:hypothetical protein